MALQFTLSAALRVVAALQGIKYKPRQAHHGGNQSMLIIPAVATTL